MNTLTTNVWKDKHKKRSQVLLISTKNELHWFTWRYYTLSKFLEYLRNNLRDKVMMILNPELLESLYMLFSFHYYSIDIQAISTSLSNSLKLVGTDKLSKTRQHILYNSPNDKKAPVNHHLRQNFGKLSRNEAAASCCL